MLFQNIKMLFTANSRILEQKARSCQSQACVVTLRSDLKEVGVGARWIFSFFSFFFFLQGPICATSCAIGLLPVPPRLTRRLLFLCISISCGAELPSVYY